MLQDEPPPYGAPPAGPPPPGGQRALPVRPAVLIIAIVVLLLGAGFGYIYVKAGGYYIISPGNAPVVSASTQCRSIGGGQFALSGGAPCVQLLLPAAKVHSVDGSILMVDVEEGKATPYQYLLAKLGLLKRWDRGSVLYPVAAIVGDTSPAQLGCQDSEQMVGAQTSASVAALRRLGYKVIEHDLGAQINGVVNGSPAASSGIDCGDLVTSIEGKPIHTADDLVAVIRTMHPGEVLHMDVQRQVGGKNRTVALTPRLGSTPAIGGQPAQPTLPFLGIQTETLPTFSFPFSVSIQVGAIGGPSAGLALTLGLLDALDSGHLTGGLKVAATGTMDTLGNVGDVGGVAQKAVAVRDAGAQVFLVPPDEYADAKSEAGSMKVYPVATLAQALQDLQSLGGQIPPAPAAASATSASGSGSG